MKRQRKPSVATADASTSRSQPAPHGGFGNAARSEQLSLTSATPDAPGTGPGGADLQTWIAPDSHVCDFHGQAQSTLGDLLSNINNIRRDIATARLAAVDDVFRYAKQADSPTWVEGLLVTFVEEALDACTGQLVSIASEHFGTLSGAQDIISGVAADVETEVLRQAIVSQPHDAGIAFFTAHRAVLQHEVNQDNSGGNLAAGELPPFLQRAMAIRTSADPCDSAAKIRDSLTQAQKQAQTRQRLATLQGWTNYLAAASAGGVGQNVHLQNAVTAAAGMHPLEEGMGHHANGVLYLDIDLGDSPESAITVLSATIEGLNQTLRGWLYPLTLDEMGISIIVRGVLPSWANYLRLAGFLGNFSGMLLGGRNTAMSLGRNAQGWHSKQCSPLGDAVIIAESDPDFLATEPDKAELNHRARDLLPGFFRRTFLNHTLNDLGVPNISNTYADRMRGRK